MTQPDFKCYSNYNSGDRICIKVIHLCFLLPVMENRNSTAYFVYVAAFLAMLFWGLSFIWTSILFEYYSPIATIFLRLVFASAFMFIALLIAGKLQAIRREHRLLLLFSAFLNPFFYFIGENYGLKFSTPATTAVMIATIPLFSPPIAWLFIRERVSLLNLFGIGISFAGILMMLLKPDLSFSASYIGVMMLMIAVVSAVIYAILLVRLTRHYNAVSIVAWQNLIGIILFLPFVLIYDFHNILETPVDARMWTALICLAVFASSMAFVLFTVAVKNLGVNRANVWSNLIPVITATASYFVLNEQFNAQKIAGIAIVIAGVLITQINKIKTRRTWINKRSSF